jgi:hypothetical protein
MLGSWWLLWIMFMLFFVPTGYGWGYRGWGPPYPSYVQRRRGARAAAAGGDSTFNHRAWGLGGDFVWLMLLVVLFWSLSAFWRR